MTDLFDEESYDEDEYWDEDSGFFGRRKVRKAKKGKKSEKSKK